MNDFNRLARILRNKHSGSDFEYTPSARQLVGMLWLRLETAQPAEQDLGDGEKVTHTHAAHARWRDCVKPTDVLEIDGVDFCVVSVVNVDERSEFMQLELIKGIKSD